MRLNWFQQRVTKKNIRRTLFRPMLERLEDRLTPSTFTVVNTADNGPGSLRQAMLDAEASPNIGGPDQIAFNIAGSGVHTLKPADVLPIIHDPAIIDGYTQPGASANKLAVGDKAQILIEIDCSVVSAVSSNLFIFAGDGSTVSGLCVNRASFYPFNIGPGFVTPGNNNT